MLASESLKSKTVKQPVQASLKSNIHSSLLSNIKSFLSKSEIDKAEKENLYRQAEFGNLDYRNKEGETMLHLAAKDGDVKLVDLLIQFGVDVNIADVIGNLPAHFAAEMGNFEILEKLKDCGANMEAKNKNGFTASEMLREFLIGLEPPDSRTLPPSKRSHPSSDLRNCQVIPLNSPNKKANKSLG